MADNRRGFAILNKNRVAVFIMTMFGGAYGTRLASGMYIRFMLWLFCSSISDGPHVGPNLIAHVSSIYKWWVQWLTWESRCCCFRGVDYLKDLDFLWPGFDFCWNVDLVAFQWCPQITWGVDSGRVRFHLCVGVHGDGVRDSLFHGAEDCMTVKAPMLLSKVIQFSVFVMLMSCIECTITSLACECHFNVSNDVWLCFSMVSWGVRVTSPPAWLSDVHVGVCDIIVLPLLIVRSLRAHPWEARCCVNGMLTLAKVLRGGEVCYCQFDHLCSSVCDRLLYGLSNPTQSRSKLVEWGVCESVWLLP